MLTSWIFANLIVSIFYALYTFEGDTSKWYTILVKTALLCTVGIFLIAFHAYMKNKKAQP